MLGELAPEYEAAARRYLGDEQAEAWVAPLRGLPMARISVSSYLGLCPRLRDPLPKRAVCLRLSAKQAQAGPPMFHEPPPAPGGSSG